MESFNNNTIMKEEKLLPVGTRVFDVRYGWGKVIERSVLADYPFRVELDSGHMLTYKHDEKFSAANKVPLLSLTEYTLENGGFTPISEYWTKPKVGDWGYFWDNEKEDSTQHIILGKLLEIKDATHPYVSCSGLCWRHFSHDIPEHIKKQMQQ